METPDRMDTVLITGGEYKENLVTINRKDYNRANGHILVNDKGQRIHESGAVMSKEAIEEAEDEDAAIKDAANKAANKGNGKGNGAGNGAVGGPKTEDKK